MSNFKIDNKPLWAKSKIYSIVILYVGPHRDEGVYAVLPYLCNYKLLLGTNSFSDLCEHCLTLNCTACLQSQSVHKKSGLQNHNISDLFLTFFVAKPDMFTYVKFKNGYF